MQVLSVKKQYKTKDSYLDLDYRLVEAKLNDGTITDVMQFKGADGSWHTSLSTVTNVLSTLREA